jgi:hypothetical protein
MTKSGFDLDEIERRARAFLFQECQPDRGDVFSWMDDRMADFIRYALHNSAPAMIAEIRELRAENARLKGVVETLYRPLQEAADAMEASGKQLADGVTETISAARAALGEPQ